VFFLSKFTICSCYSGEAVNVDVPIAEVQWWKPENILLSKYRTPEYIAMKKQEYAKMLEEVHRSQALGLRLLAGTDITIPYTYPGFSLHDELKLFCG
jgi:hypothetical protein